MNKWRSSIINSTSPLIFCWKETVKTKYYYNIFFVTDSPTSANMVPNTGDTVWFLLRFGIMGNAETYPKVMWRLNVVDSQQGHLTAACDLRDIVYTFLLTCQHANKAYLFSTTRRTWTYIHIQCPCNLRLIYSYRCFSNSAVFSL